MTGNVISVPVVEITLHSSLCNGSYFCGLVSTLPDGIAVLVGNYICTDTPVTDVTVVTRSQTGVLVRTWGDKLSRQKASFHQLVVPTSLRAKLLSVAHEIPAAGHLGTAKTKKERLLRHFYWPSITKDVKDFCRSCDICQRLGKCAPNPPAPLHNLPLVEKQFSQIAIDIVGPLPVCKNSGRPNRFILTVLDLCTHYTEAIPMKQHTAQDVARALSL